MTAKRVKSAARMAAVGGAVVAVAVQAELVQDGLQKGLSVKGRGGHCRDFLAPSSFV